MNLELQCPHCGYTRSVPRERIPAGVRGATCPRCSRRFELAGAGAACDAAGGPPEVDEKTQPAWERRPQLGLAPAIFGTFRTVLFSPARLFQDRSFRGGFREPLAFGLLAGAMGAMFGLFWQFVLVAGGMSERGGGLLAHLTVGRVFLLLLVVIPLAVTIGMLLYSAAVHVCLLVVGAGKSGFEGTFRVVAYSQAAQLWTLIPLAGGWIALGWQLTVQVIGLREVHASSYLRLVLAGLIPLAVLLLLAALLFLLLYEVLLRP